jgi:hypothetical protein
MQAVVKVVSPVQLKLSALRSQWKTCHLPDGSHGLWRKTFVTTFIAYIGTKYKPWQLKDRESIEAMQSCWDHVYRSTAVAQYRISGLRDIVFHLVGVLALVKYRLMQLLYIG